MQSKIDQLEKRRKDLVKQVGSEGTVGILQTELAAVKQKLSAVSADMPTEDVIMASQQEAALGLKLTNGKAELKRVENEIAHIQLMENQAGLRVQREHEAEQEKIRRGLARIAEIDGNLDGTRPLPLLRPVKVNGRPSDIRDDHRNRCETLKRERAQLVAEVGRPEEHELRKNKERVAELEAIFAGRQRFPELPYDVQQAAGARRKGISSSVVVISAERWKRN